MSGHRSPGEGKSGCLTFPNEFKTVSKSLLRRWFSRAPLAVPETIEAKAERGDADVQFGLGLKYANGEGTTQDYVQAARWYLKSAEQDHALAQFNLGIM